jgi:hypothetical protein
MTTRFDLLSTATDVSVTLRQSAVLSEAPRPLGARTRAWIIGTCQDGSERREFVRFGGEASRGSYTKVRVVFE